ncbi:hypothetical protein GQ600_20683 [Phytophthora cactorum]|nr:hypothetical protein GQ600_20683 [Phytophthora cactorum]
MLDAIDAFKEKNPIMIDKDFGENTIVRICHFHLKKCLRTEMSKTEYGGRDATDVDRVEDAVDMMYDWGLRYMIYILDGCDEEDALPEPKHLLLTYFMHNGHTCKDIWAVYKRGNVAHLGNHTNNRYAAFFFTCLLNVVLITFRLESAWGDLKKI